MRPSSLLGVLLDYLEILDEDNPQPADVQLSKFYRERRFLGSKDRRFVGDAAYAFLRYRHRGEKRWELWKQRNDLQPNEEGRTLHLGALFAIAEDGFFPWSSMALVDAGATYAAAVGGGWSEVLERIRINNFLNEKDWPTEPVERLACELSLPLWLARYLVEQRGESEVEELGKALLQIAPVDIRVNLSSIEREVVRADLEKKYQAEVDFTPLSTRGLRVKNRINFRQFLSRNKGWAEVQDEGSQIAAMATEVQPGSSVIDACAGGGGKTLALADLVNGKGKFHVCDIDASKLQKLLNRADPIGFRSLTPHQISPDGELPPSLPSKADLVVCDVPCSGLGSLRRNPDLKTRYTQDDIERFSEIQSDILERFSERVGPGGSLVYITCSILAQENEEIVEKFLENNPNFEAYTPEIAQDLPEGCIQGDWLRLDPIKSGTDGFFIAHLKKEGGEE